MRKFLALFLLAVPFISSAQSGPQMQISNLQAGAVGQEITGSFVLNNVGETNIPDVQYYVAVGNYGEDGGILDNETAVTPLSESVYLPTAARLEVPFSITAKNLPAGDIGLHVIATQKNGTMIGWKKIPLEITGNRSNASQIIEGYYIINGDKYSLESGVPFGEGEMPTFFVESEGLADGTQDVKVTVYEKSVGGKKISNETISVDFMDGVGQLLLPEGLKPKQYAGNVSLADGSNVLTMRFMIAGPQAEVLEVDSDLLSLKKGQDFVMTLTYADTPLNAFDPVSTEYPENLTARVKVLSESGKVVSEFEQPLAVTQKQELLEVDENSTEAEQEEATRRLEIMLNNKRVLDIPLSAKAKAKALTFEVELFDAKSGEVYDTYSTTLPVSPEGYPARLVLLATLAIILILLILLFKTAKHKIPMVCLALVLGSVALVGIAMEQADAYITPQSDYANFNSHEFFFSAPISSRTGGYNQGVTIPLDVKVDATAWRFNGLLTHKVRYPVYTSDWSSFTSASAALTHIQLRANHNDDSKYAESTENATWSQDFSVSYQYIANGGTIRTPNLTPGKHWIPVSSRFCTASHGCSGWSYVVYETCVNGANQCAGETVDYCPLMNGVTDAAVQTTLPVGYSKVGDNCVNNCASPLAGTVCGCNNAGTVQCDGSCSVSETCTPPADDLEVSCTANPSAISASTNVTFTAVPTGTSNPVTYVWENITSGGSVSETSNIYTKSAVTATTTMKVTATSGTETDSDLCTVVYNAGGDLTCTEPRPACTTGCVGGVWQPGTCTASAPTAIFNFQPRIVAPGGSCRVSLDTTNTSLCEIYKGGSRIDTYNGDVNGIINIDPSSSETVNVGTYDLFCTGMNPGDTPQKMTTKQCIAAPVLREF